MAAQHPDRRHTSWLDPTRVAFACIVVLVALVVLVVSGSGHHATSDRAGLDSLDDPAAGFTEVGALGTRGDDDRAAVDASERADAPAGPALRTPGGDADPTVRPRPTSGRPTPGGGTTGTGGGGAPTGSGTPQESTPGGNGTAGTGTGTGTGSGTAPVAVPPATPAPQVPVGPTPATPQPLAQLTDVLAPVVDPVLGVVRGTVASVTPVAPALVTPLLGGVLGARPAGA